MKCETEDAGEGRKGEGEGGEVQRSVYFSSSFGNAVRLLLRGLGFDPRPALKCFLQGLTLSFLISFFFERRFEWWVMRCIK